jgi:hypothetical protein
MCWYWMCTPFPTIRNGQFLAACMWMPMRPSNDTIPKRSLPSTLTLASRPVVTVCGVGKTSQIAAEQLAARGVQVYSLEGGMKAWSLAWNTASIVIAGSAVQVIQVRRTGKDASPT